MKKTGFAAAVLSAVLISVSTFSAAVQAEDAVNLQDTVLSPSVAYSNYISEHKDTQKPLEEITCSAQNAIVPKERLVTAEEGIAAEYTESGQSAVFPLTVSAEGMYGISLSYCSVTGNEQLFTPIEINVTVDGREDGFEWLKGLTLERIWQSTGEIETDSAGNEMTPERNELFRLNSQPLLDEYTKPVSCFFSAGEHTVAVAAISGSFRLFSVTLYNEAEPEKYVKPDFSDDTGTFYLKTEAEDCVTESSAAIIPENDPSDVNTSPSDPVVRHLNYIPGSKYKAAGSWLEWELDVPEDGYYRIDMRVRQNYNSGMSSLRSLEIDGKVPFAECGEIRFPYSGAWYTQSIGDGNEPYMFYLTKGKHILRFTAVYGSMAKVVADAGEIIYSLNSLYSSVIMRLGTNPDRYRDYNLKNEIPGIRDTLKDIAVKLRALGEDVRSTNGGKTGSAMATIQTLLNMLEGFISNPDRLALKTDSLKNNTVSLAAFVNGLNEQPLDMDYICVYSANRQPENEKAGIAQRISFDFRRLCASFFSDYSLSTSGDAGNSLSVWAAVGRDQLKVLKRLIESGFVKETGADVSLAINTDLTGAVLAGVGPDVCLFTSADAPVNFAVRNVLVDLEKLEGFKEISARFNSQALTPFKSVGGCYGLPLSQTWPMLFVRTDIFTRLGLTVPETWDGMYATAAVLQRNHLEIGIPSHIGMFLTLLYQNGGSVFDEDLKTTFYDRASLDAFSTWSSFFSQYSFPLSYDFFNRFRSGEMPIGIADYTAYAQLKEAAPEIRGQWKMYKLPGTRDENGGVNSSISISIATGITADSGLAQGETAAVIFKDNKNVSLSWDFLRWFTDAKVQADYGNGIEAELGCYGRYTAANLEAMTMLPWTTDELSILEAARKNIVTVDEYPGGYYIAREINNAFRSAVNEKVNPADILSRKNVLINKELSRKYKQFGIKVGAE